MKQPNLVKKESEKMQYQQTQIKYKPNPEQKAWCLSKLYFGWTNQIITNGVEKNIHFKEEDFYDIEERDTFNSLRNELDQAKKNNPKANLLSQIMYQDKLLIIFYCILSIIANGLQFAGPLFLNLIIKLLQDEEVSDDEFWEKGITYVALLFLCFFLRSFFLQHTQHGTTRITYNIVQKVLALLFDKTLHLSAQAQKYQDAGKMTNLVSINLVEIVIFFMFAFSAMSSPIIIIASCVYIVFELSWIGLIGPFCIFLISIYVKKMQDTQQDFRKKAFVYIDRRSKKVQEFLGGIKAIKYYAWEKFVSKQLDDVRKQELEVLYDISFMMGKVTVISQVAPALTSVVIFAIYIAMGEEMTPERAFTVIALLNIMQMPFQQIVGSYQQLSNALVATERVNHYLQTESFDDNYCIRSSDSEGNVLAIKDAKFSWNSNYNEEHNAKNPDMLRYKLLAQEAAQKQAKKKKSKTQIKEDLIQDLERQIQTQNKETVDLQIQKLQIKKGDFIGVIGKFSSGKSSLLHAIIGEMKKLEGNINIDGSIAFIPQKAWIRSCTLKDNILFGLPYNKEKYERVIKESQLQQDLDQLPGGEQTEIGEKGVNLSGGQKQRVQIARALYADCDLMIADDVLSALDSHVGKKVFHKAFKSKKGAKTTVFVTHALHYLPHFDKIIIMEEGKMIDFGTYQELKNTENLKKIIVDHKKNDKKDENDGEKEKEQEIEEENLDYVDSDDEAPQQNAKQENNLQTSLANKDAKQDQVQSNQQIQIEEKSKDETEKQDNDKKKKGAMVKVEDKSQGSVPLAIYTQFIRLGGFGLLSIALTTFALGQAAKMATDWWLGIWSVYKYEDSMDGEDGWYLLIYSGIAIASALLFLLRTQLFTKFTVNASRSVFISLFERILYAPQKFFDTTPLGRIVSRLSADVNMVDWGITFSLQACVFGILVVVSACILISIITPWFLIVFALLSIFYVLLIQRFLTAAREMKKLNNNLRGPLIGGQAEAADGLTIIRSFQQQKMITTQFDTIADNWYRSAMNEQWCLRWSGLITDIISAFVIGFSAFFGILAKSEGSANMAALLGLSLTYALQIALTLPMTVMLLANLELSMDSVQRILDYTNDLEQEKDHFHPKKPENWPSQGALEIKDIRYRYREGLPLVLKGISFKVEQKQKIGVIGRTGSGKSTLTLGLLRILELADKKEKDEQEFNKGEIILDGVNIENIGLTELRNSIAMIPQEPVLFSGTVRLNIDPFSKYSDQSVIDAIKQVALLDTFQQKLQQVKEKEEQEAKEKQEKLGQQNLTIKKQTSKKHQKGSVSEELQEILNMPVENEGKNFSQGERQLLSMARVLVRKPKILIMDEATASIDEKTDQFIQQMIKTQFSSTTVITIAHRLNTIMQYDRILVLDYGEVKAWGSPQEMLNDQNSYLYSLVKGQGNEYLDQMQAMANNAEDEKKLLLQQN